MSSGSRSRSRSHMVLALFSSVNGCIKHISTECTTKCLRQEPGHMGIECHNVGICHTCGKSRHWTRDCTAQPLPLGDMRLCNNCHKQGHTAADCINEKTCNNCRKTGYLAHDCPNEPICNTCNISGNVARQCPKAHLVDHQDGIGGAGRSFRDVVCRSCGQIGHMSRDWIATLVCYNCGGRGHATFECPLGRMLDHFPPVRLKWNYC